MDHDYSRSYSSSDEGIDFQLDARLLVARYYNQNIAYPGDSVWITTDDVYVVWFSKTLKNWKALLSTTKPDGRYYEVTHNGEKNETYLDAYVKEDNVCYSRNKPLPNIFMDFEEWKARSKPKEKVEPNFRDSLREVLNKFSAEVVSGTPDYILADYLVDCLKTYNQAVVDRADWRGESTELPALQEPKDSLDEDTNSEGCGCYYCQKSRDFNGETKVNFQGPGFSAEMFIEDITKPEMKCSCPLCGILNHFGLPDHLHYYTKDN